MREGNRKGGKESSLSRLIAEICRKKRCRERGEASRGEIRKKKKKKEKIRKRQNNVFITFVGNSIRLYTYILFTGYIERNRKRRKEKAKKKERRNKKREKKVIRREENNPLSNKLPRIIRTYIHANVRTLHARVRVIYICSLRYATFSRMYVIRVRRERTQRNRVKWTNTRSFHNTEQKLKSDWKVGKRGRERERKSEGGVRGGK